MISTPTSPHGPVERAQVVAAISPQGSIQFDFRDRLGSIDSDLTDTEKEGERLSKKLNKRLSGGSGISTDVTSPAEYFMDKLSKWHSNKKVEKLKALLAQHLPKLRHLEEDVMTSANSVHENADAVQRQALALLGLVDQQIEYYQHHMNFLDDVINDIRQCDFNLVREIHEMKAAFAFVQEVDNKATNPTTSRLSTPANPCTILLKIGADGAGYVPGRRVLEDDAKVLGFTSPNPNPLTTEDLAIPVPAVVQAPRSVKLNDVVTALPELAAGKKGTSTTSSTGNSRDGSPTSNAHDGGIAAMETAFDPVLDNRDGAEYKRKCLKSQAVDLQMLNLEKINGIKNTGHGAHAAEAKKAPPMSPSNFMRSVGEKLSEMAHFPKAQTPTSASKALVEKHRSWSVSSANSGAAGDSTKSSSQEGSSGKNRVNRSPSLGSVFFPAQTQTETMAAAAGAEKRPAPAAHLVHKTTPRPLSASAGQSGGGGHHGSHAVPTIPIHEAGHKVEGGIAFEGLAPAGAFAPVDAHTAQHLTAASILAHGHSHSGHAHGDTPRANRTPSFSGQLSTSSSCSNLSHSTSSAPPPSAADPSERRRRRLSALRNHYPNLYQIAHAHTDPGVKLLARRLNKCLMFKDELKRSLVKAELVQEAENSCLCKMRKVQHELQDILAERRGTLSSSSTSTLPLCKGPSSPRHHEHTHSMSGGSSTFLSSLSVDHGSAAELGHTADSAGTHSPGRGLANHPLMANISHLSDHDFSSTDDEHDHLTNSNISTHSRDTSFSLGDGGALSPRAAAAAAATITAAGNSNGAADHGLIEPHLERIPSDPTIIDPNQDAEVNQISYELFEAAHRCAQQLKMLLEEEDEATDKLNRVRQLLSSAQHIDHQLLTTLAPKK